MIICFSGTNHKPQSSINYLGSNLITSHSELRLGQNHDSSLVV